MSSAKHALTLFFAKKKKVERILSRFALRMADDFERAILYAFDHTGAVGPELKVKR